MKLLESRPSVWRQPAGPQLAILVDGDEPGSGEDPGDELWLRGSACRQAASRASVILRAISVMVGLGSP
ncbi:hypothetical protein AB0G06_24560, partial [Nonomuraea dietziae]|uniref:hypothetical protein n=1 Tax=Nonomuraea dietziae TaxID=65515 RepID=UPI0034092C90